MTIEKLTPEELEERRYRVLLLTQAGGSLRVIGRELGISHQQVKRDRDFVLDGLADDVTQSTVRARALCNSRIERLIAALWGRALGVGEDRRPDLEAVDRVRRLLELQIRLSGTARPPAPLGPSGRAVQVVGRSGGDSEE